MNGSFSQSARKQTAPPRGGAVVFFALLALDRLRDVAVGHVGAARAVLLVGFLDARDAIGDDLGLLLRRDAVEPRVVAAENRGLDRAVGRAQRLEAVLLLHVFR